MNKITMPIKTLFRSIPNTPKFQTLVADLIGADAGADAGGNPKLAKMVTKVLYLTNQGPDRLKTPPGNFQGHLVLGQQVAKLSVLVKLLQTKSPDKIRDEMIKEQIKETNEKMEKIPEFLKLKLDSDANEAAVEAANNAKEAAEAAALNAKTIAKAIFTTINSEANIATDKANKANKSAKEAKEVAGARCPHWSK